MVENATEFSFSIEREIINDFQHCVGRGTTRLVFEHRYLGLSKELTVEISRMI